MDKVAPTAQPQVPPPPEEGGAPRAGRAAWTLVDCLGAFLLGILLSGVGSALVGFVLAAASGGGTGGLALSRDMLTVVSQMVFFVVLAATVFAWVRVRYPGHARRLLGAAAPGSRDLLLGLGLGVLAFLVLNVGLGSLVEALTRLAGMDPPAVQEELQRLARQPETAPYFVVVAAVLAPLAEETFFRGMLFPAFARRLGVSSGIVLSALLFALLHGVESLLTAQVAETALVVGLIFPLGLLLGWIYHRRGTLAVPILVHAVFNLITVLGLALL